MLLKNLIASSVRGLPKDWPSLELGERGTVIYGPNGVGKSSIVDALEFAVCAKSSLYPVSRQNVNWETGSPHVRGGHSDIELEVADGKHSFQLLSTTDPEEVGGAGRSWLEAARNASFVLRRHMLLRFVSEEPRGRYSLLQPFLSLDEYQQIEDQLREWKDHLETQQALATASSAQHSSSIRTAFEIDQNTELNEALLLSSFNLLFRNLNEEPAGDLQRSLERQREVAAKSDGNEKTERIANLIAIKNAAENLGRPTDLIDLLVLLISAQASAEAARQGRAEELLTEFLELGKHAIENSDRTDCPLCEQEIQRDSLLERIRIRLAADEHITSLQKIVDERIDELLRRTRPLVTALKQFTHQLNKYVPSAASEEYQSAIAALEELTSTLESNVATSAALFEAQKRIESSVSSYDSVIATIQKKIEEEGGGETRSRLIKLFSMADAVSKHWDSYLQAGRKLEDIRRRLIVVQKLHMHSIEARKSAVGQILMEVAQSANTFYERIHPGEEISKSNLQVREVGQGSVILSTTFYGNVENPLLHFSESHLDTLGLCYFLAMRKREAEKNPIFKILILDDVLHSVDSAHRTRIASLLKDEFADHQVIVTTHDLYFFEVLRRELGTNGFTYYRINNWDIDRGPVLGDPLTDFDRIMSPCQRETLSEETLSAAGGRFFEWLLKEVNEGLEVAIPLRIKRGYEIGQLWPALASRLRRQPGYHEKYEQLILQLEQNAWVRNACGAHHNEVAVPPSPSEVRQFTSLLAELYASLHCDDCRAFVGKQSDGSWRCKGDHLTFRQKQSA